MCSLTAEGAKCELGVRLSYYKEVTVSKDAIVKAIGRALSPLYSHYSWIMQRSEAC